MRTESAPTAPSFRELYDAHIGFVWRTLARLGVRDAELEDAAQEVFLVVHRRLDEFEGRAKLTTWMFRICHRIARDRARRAWARHEVLTSSEPTDPSESAASPEAVLERQDALAELDRALGSMSLDHRAVFVLFELEGFTSEEVARALGVPLGTVYSRLRRARQLFHKSLHVPGSTAQRPFAPFREGAR